MGRVEIKASDSYREAIEDIALRGAMFNTFTDDGEYLKTSTGKEAIILDEATACSPPGTGGPCPAIVKLINETRQPVIHSQRFLRLSKKGS